MGLYGENEKENENCHIIIIGHIHLWGVIVGNKGIQYIGIKQGFLFPYSLKRASKKTWVSA